MIGGQFKRLDLEISQRERQRESQRKRSKIALDGVHDDFEKKIGPK